MKCPSCATEIDSQAVYCQECGTRLDMSRQQFPPEHEEAGVVTPAGLSDSGFTTPVIENNNPERADVSRSSSAAEMQTPQPQPPEMSAAKQMRSQGVGTRVDTSPEHLWEGGYSGKAMVGAWLISLLITIVVLIGAFKFLSGGTWWGIAFGALGICWLIPTLKYAYRRMSVRYELTDHRFVHQHGILFRTTDRIELVDIFDISYRQSIVDRMFGVGTITINSRDATDPILVLPGIDDIKTVAARMEEARRGEQLRREIHIEGR